MEKQINKLLSDILGCIARIEESTSEIHSFEEYQSSCSRYFMEPLRGNMGRPVSHRCGCSYRPANSNRCRPWGRGSHFKAPFRSSNPLDFPLYSVSTIKSARFLNALIFSARFVR